MKSVLILALVCCVSVVSSVTLSKVPEAVGKKWDIAKLGSLGDIWTNCTKDTDGSTILDVKISPDPPRQGKDVTINATVNFKEEVTGGDVTIKVKAGPENIDTTEKLCDLAKEANLTCPLSSGVKTFTAKEHVPSVPFGITIHVTGSVTVTDQNNKQLACVDIDFELKK